MSFLITHLVGEVSLVNILFRDDSCEFVDHSWIAREGVCRENKMNAFLCASSVHSVSLW